VTDSIDAAGVYQLSEKKERPPSNRITAGLDALWRWLTDYRLLLAVGLFTLIFLLLAYLLPQMPDQLRGDPGESTRWLVTTAAHYGPFGDLLSQFGFFNVLQSPLLKIALVVIAMLLLIHLAELMGAAWQLRKLSGLRQAQAAMTQAAGEPLPLPPGRRIVRLRTSVAICANEAGSETNDETTDETTDPTVDSLADTLAASMAASLGDVQRQEVDVQPSPTVAAILDDPMPVTEIRLLAVRGLTATYLRPLLMLGLLLALAAVWLLINFGWALSVPTLTPGKTERFAAQNVELRYDVTMGADAAGDVATPVLTISVGDHEQRLDVSDGGRMTVNGVVVTAFPTAPGLLLRTSGDQPLLTLPGQSTPATSIGLIFPTVGSEEVVLLKNESTGLRIVRIGSQDSDTGVGEPADGDKFMVEIFRSTTAEPDQRIEINGRTPRVITLDEGQTVDLLPVDGVSAQLRHTPGSWLVWPALALILAGIYGFWKKPAFVLVQIAPWTQEKAVIVAQSDLASELTKIEDEIEHKL